MCLSTIFQNTPFNLISNYCSPISQYTIYISLISILSLNIKTSPQIPLYYHISIYLPIPLPISYLYYQLQHLHSKTSTTIINIHIPFISYTHYTYHTIIKYSINTSTTKNIHYSIYKHNYTYINIY